MFEIPTLETPQLIIRKFNDTTDIEELFSLCSIVEVMRTWGTPPHQSRNDTLALVHFLRDAANSGKMLRWAMVDKQSSKLIGDVGFWRFVPERKRAEVGVKIFPQNSSKGISTEALAKVVDYGFERLGLNSIEANIILANTAASRMVEKIGFKREGLIRENSICPITGEYMDTYLYSILKKDRWTSA